MLAAANRSAPAQAIPNAGFEANTFTVWPGYASGNGGVINGWTASAATRVGLNPANGSPFADNGATPQGANVAFLQFVSSLSTTIAGLTEGDTYRVTFRANSRGAPYAAPSATCSLNGGAAAGFTCSPPVGGTNPYYTVQQTFTARHYRRAGHR